MDYSKSDIIELILQQVAEALERQQRVYDQTCRDSVEAEGAMQSRHNTTKDEMARLANALMNNIIQTREAVEYFKQLEMQEQAPDTVTVGTLVRVRDEGEIGLYFIAEHGGAQEVQSQQGTVFVLSPHSPMGKALFGRQAGSCIELQVPSGTRTLNILSVE